MSEVHAILVSAEINVFVSDENTQIIDFHVDESIFSPKFSFFGGDLHQIRFAQ
jgi:hypothetical protein